MGAHLSTWSTTFQTIDECCPALPLMSEHFAFDGPWSKIVMHSNVTYETESLTSPKLTVELSEHCDGDSPGIVVKTTLPVLSAPQDFEPLVIACDAYVPGSTSTTSPHDASEYAFAKDAQADPPGFVTGGE